MANARTKTWSSGLGFVLATAGAAVGLGNLWRFPFLAGENGGGAFVLIYIVCVLIIGLPIMLAELALGREGGGSAVHTIRSLVARNSANRFWMIIGIMSIFIPFVGIAYYSVVGGWVVDFAATGLMGQAGQADGAAAQAQFDTMLGNPARLLATHSLFMIGVMGVLMRGVQGGIERLSKILMPALFILLIGLMVYAALTADMKSAAAFLLQPDFSAVTGKTVVLAMGQAFFSLAIGVGVMITYGAYVSEDVSLTRAVAMICFVDTAVALLAGFIIFPFVFVHGLDPAGGPGLLFVTLPTAFGQMAGGGVIGAGFFVLLFFAAFTTGVGTLEPVVAWLEERRNFTRIRATLVAGCAAWLVGIAALLSFNIWSELTPLNFVPGYGGKNIFDIMDFTIASILLPFNGLMIALFTGWVVGRSLKGKLGMPAGLEKFWLWGLRLIVPAAIALIALWK